MLNIQENKKNEQLIDNLDHKKSELMLMRRATAAV